MRECDIDIAIANLVHLKGGQVDDLSKLLSPAIEALKDYRTNRASWKKLLAELKEAKKSEKASRVIVGFTEGSKDVRRK